MYKLTRPDGFDFYSGTINYRKNIGKIIKLKDFDPKNVGVCGKGLHASQNPNDCFVGATIPCAAFKVRGIQPIAKDNRKTRYQAVKVLMEITDLNNLFGWNYTEAINPIHPFKIKPPEIIEKHIELLREWDSVRDSVRDSMWDSMWASVWDSVWASVWAYIGSFFTNIKTWKYIKHEKGKYPFQPCVDLWETGLVPSFDGKVWRLHGGKNAKILYEMKIK